MGPKTCDLGKEVKPKSVFGFTFDPSRSCGIHEPPHRTPGREPLGAPVTALFFRPPPSSPSIAAPAPRPTTPGRQWRRRRLLLQLQPRFGSSSFIMVLKTYKSARSRFTWRLRNVDNDNTLPAVMGNSKNQKDYGHDNCSYVGTCCALEAHVRMKTKDFCELSPMDLEEKVVALTNANEDMRSKGRMTRCFYILCNEGVVFEGSQETCKVESYREHHLTASRGHAACAVNDYLRHGPMIGVFKVCKRDFNLYGQSTGFDAIHFVNHSGLQYPTHAVTISGFGLQASCPFWEFQNTHGPSWRGAARGYGQLYALHLIELYGFRLGGLVYTM